MTKAYSTQDDNNGRCESCDRPESVNEPQTTYPVMLGGGLGLGTMWLCQACRKSAEEQDAKRGTIPPKVATSSR